MIRKLTVEGMTVFQNQESFNFVPGINIIVGGNDGPTGKLQIQTEWSPRAYFSQGDSKGIVLAAV